MKIERNLITFMGALNKKGVVEMSDLWVVLCAGLTSVAGSVTAISVIIKPLKGKVDDIVAKEIEKEKEEQRMKTLEGWTGSQQEDLDDFNEGLVILAGAVEALLDHAIEKQEGNGKCHKAQEEVEGFLRDKALSKKSRKKE